jgi:hypothetical protein
MMPPEQFQVSQFRMAIAKRSRRMLEYVQRLASENPNDVIQTHEHKGEFKEW